MNSLKGQVDTQIPHKSLNQWTLLEKLELLRRLDNGEKISLISLETGIGERTIRRWNSSRAEWENFVLKRENTNFTCKRKRMRLAASEELDNVLLFWFEMCKKEGFIPSGPTIRRKALIFHDKLNRKRTFYASGGWLNRWQQRYGVNLSDPGYKKLDNLETMKASLL